MTTASSLDLSKFPVCLRPVIGPRASICNFSRVESRFFLITSASATTRASACWGKNGAIQLPAPAADYADLDVEFAWDPKTVLGSSSSTPPVAFKIVRRSGCDGSIMDASSFSANPLSQIRPILAA